MNMKKMKNMKNMKNMKKTGIGVKIRREKLG